MGNVCFRGSGVALKRLQIVIYLLVKNGQLCVCILMERFERYVEVICIVLLFCVWFRCSYSLALRKLFAIEIYIWIPCSY
jgi:hypothetical protein